jgi:hypothetical protein
MLDEADTATKEGVMPASLTRIKKDLEANVKRTAKDAGTRLIIDVTAYDNGMVTLYGTPLNDHVNYDQTEGWLAAVENVVLTLHEFQKREVKRRRSAPARNLT